MKPFTKKQLEFAASPLLYSYEILEVFYDQVCCGAPDNVGLVLNTYFNKQRFAVAVEKDHAQGNKVAIAEARVHLMRQIDKYCEYELDRDLHRDLHDRIEELESELECVKTKQCDCGCNYEPPTYTLYDVKIEKSRSTPGAVKVYTPKGHYGPWNFELPSGFKLKRLKDSFYMPEDVLFRESFPDMVEPCTELCVSNTVTVLRDTCSCSPRSSYQPSEIDPFMRGFGILIIFGLLFAMLAA